jgi:hypothetical protein
MYAHRINYMEQSFWEASSRSDSQEIIHILWKATIYCRAYNISSLDHILSQLNPAQILQHLF